jgi:uncharacterized protein YggE
MNRSVALAFAAVLVAVPGSAQTTLARSITVNGTAEVKVPPNEVILTIGVETDSLDVVKARGENDLRVKAIAEAARSHAVAAEHVRTDFLDIQPRYNDSGRRQFLGFFARRSLVITLRDVSKFEPLLSSVLTAGANYVHGIDFRTTDVRKHRDAARAMALTAAREKAGAMAATLNVSLGAPANIQEGHSGWWSPYSSWWGTRGGMMAQQNAIQIPGGRDGSDDVLVPGLISVSANVSVTFDLVQSR